MNQFQMTSPGTKSGVRKDYRMDPTQFEERNNEIKAALRAVIKLSNFLSTKNDNSVTITGTMNGQVETRKIGKAQIKSWLSTIFQHMNTLPMIFRASLKKPKKTDSKRSTQLHNLFYISKQFSDFVAASVLGNGSITAIMQSSPGTKFSLATQEAANMFANYGGNAVDNIRQLVVDNQIANSGILVGLLHLIATVNRLKSVSSGKRVHVSQVMSQYFGNGSNTHYILGGVDLSVDANSKLQTLRTTLDEEKFAALQVHLGSCQYDCLSRIGNRGISGKETEPAYIPYNGQQSDNHGILLSMFMVLISTFRIPSYLLTPAQAQAIASGKPKLVIAKGTSKENADAMITAHYNLVESNQVITMAKTLTKYVSGLLSAYKDIEEPAKKEATKIKDRAKKQAKKAFEAQQKGVSLGLPVGLGLPLPGAF